MSPREMLAAETREWLDRARADLRAYKPTVRRRGCWKRSLSISNPSPEVEGEYGHHEC